MSIANYNDYYLIPLKKRPTREGAKHIACASIELISWASVEGITKHFSFFSSH